MKKERNVLAEEGEEEGEEAEAEDEDEVGAEGEEEAEAEEGEDEDGHHWEKSRALLGMMWTKTRYQSKKTFHNIIKASLRDNQANRSKEPQIASKAKSTP